MQLLFRTLCSGSDGNSVLVSDGDTHLLFDAGLGIRAFENSIRACGISPQALSGILITHEHSDHIKGVDAISAKYSIPVYATNGTWAAMEKKMNRVLIKNRIPFDRASDFYINDFNIQPFRIPHDAADPCGYEIVNKGKKIIIATDMGYANQRLVKRVQDADLLYIESNYDPEMLENGPYPLMLRQRIAGNKGHLSNQDCAQVISAAVFEGSVRNIILGHLSENNNTSELALLVSSEALSGMGLKVGKDISLSVAKRLTPSDPVILE
ncbi:MAG: MBL fold metallo-hydrolase [Clostridia bacterium]|nr:MBL fold metallo-hydrolase [Clostridia bacterium]